MKELLQLIKNLTLQMLLYIHKLESLQQYSKVVIINSYFWVYTIHYIQ